MKKPFLLLWILLPASGLFAQDTAKKTDELISAYQKLGKFNGTALVASHDKILLEKGYGYRNVDKQTLNDPQTIFQIASITKTFTSAAVLKLVQLQKISLTDKLSKWYPAFPNADKITIENLLSHTSGIYDYAHEDTATHLNTEEKMITFLSKKPLDFEPGSNWAYSNSGYSILGFIIRKVSGMPYEQLVRNYIFKLLKMNCSGFDFEHLENQGKAIGYSVMANNVNTVSSYSDSSIVFAAGAIYSTVGDLYKWHKALQSYQVAGKELMTKAYTPFRKNYGYGWIIDSVGAQKMVYHSGNIAGFCSVLIRIPQDDICIILLNNKEGTELETIARKIIDILYNRPYAMPTKKTAINLPESVLERYVGTYEIADIHLVIEVTIQNNQLIAHAVDGPTFTLTAEKQNLFFIQDSQAEIEFVVGATGTADKLVLNQNNQKKIGKRIK